MSNSTRTLSTRIVALRSNPALTRALLIFGFAAATAAGARLEIPHEPVPYTLQTLVVLLAGAFLGPRDGGLSQLLYLGAGAVGLPVYAGGAFGPAILFGPTAGYLAAFPIAAVVVGSLVTMRRGLGWTFLSMAAGLLVIFLAGTLVLYAVAVHKLAQAFSSGFLIFSWWDVIKLCAAATTYHEVAKRWTRNTGH